MTRSIARIVAIGAVGALVAAAPALGAAPPKKVGTKINVAGSSIGALKVGMSPSQARSLLGKPDNQDSQGFSGNSANTTLSYSRYGLTLDFWQGTQGGGPKLGIIFVKSSQYKANGVGIGSSVTQLQKALGKNLRCWSGKSFDSPPFCDYRSSKANATFNLKNNKVTGIRLGT